MRFRRVCFEIIHTYGICIAASVNRLPLMCVYIVVYASHTYDNPHPCKLAWPHKTHEVVFLYFPHLFMLLVVFPENCKSGQTHVQKYLGSAGAHDNFDYCTYSSKPHPTPNFHGSTTPPPRLLNPNMTLFPMLGGGASTHNCLPTPTCLLPRFGNNPYTPSSPMSTDMSAYIIHDVAGDGNCLFRAFL